MPRATYSDGIPLHIAKTHVYFADSLITQVIARLRYLPIMRDTSCLPVCVHLHYLPPFLYRYDYQ